MLDSPGGVNRMLGFTPSDARAETDTLSRRELTEWEEDSAKRTRDLLCMCTPGGGQSVR